MNQMPNNALQPTHYSARLSFGVMHHAKAMKLDSEIQRALISTTSRFVGEFESDAVRVAHAWPQFGKGNIYAKLVEGPLSRSAYVVSFLTKPLPKKGVLPDYSRNVDHLCDCLSLLYEKRFDNHGLFEGSGTFRIPDLTSYHSICDSSLAYNSHEPREDFPSEGNLSEISRLTPVLYGTPDSSFRIRLSTAARFYSRALRDWERDPEIAYIHLISAIEVMLDEVEFDKDDLLDDQALACLKLLDSLDDDISSIRSFIYNRLLQIKRRFVETIVCQLDSAFFKKNLDNTTFGCFVESDIRKTVSAAYDLRSKYVHSGEEFGNYVNWKSVGRGEVHFGKPVVNNKELSKIIMKAPLLRGLERLVRYTLFKLALDDGAILPASEA